MTIESEDDILNEISSWSDFSSMLRKGDRELLEQILNEVKEYKDAIATKGELFTVAYSFHLF